MDTVISWTMTNFRPFTNSYNPSYNGIASVYVSDADYCIYGDCGTNVEGGPSVQSSMHCPKDRVITAAGPGGLSFGLKILGSGSARTAICQRSIPLVEPPTNCGLFNPILPASGEKIQIETDYQSPDGVLSFSRNYRSITGTTNSLLTSSFVDNSIIGVNFNGCYSSWYLNNAQEKVPVCATYMSSGDGTQVVTLKSGRQLRFRMIGSEAFAINYPLNKLSKYTNSSSEVMWELLQEDNSISHYDDSGRLQTYKFPSGRAISYTYSDGATPQSIATRPGLIIQITDDRGRNMQFNYNADDQLVKMIDPSALEYEYTYDLYNNLMSVIYPDATSKSYFYGELANINGGVTCSSTADTYSRLLTGIEDENGDRFADFKYQCDGKAISSEHNNGVALGTLAYTASSTITTNPLGKQTTYHYTTMNGVRRVTQVEGHQSNNCAAANKAYTYDDNGFLETKTDWQGNITRYTRNAKGQELTRIEAENTAVERTITTQWHTTFNVPTKITEPGQETTFTYDTNGNQVSRVLVESTP